MWPQKNQEKQFEGSFELYGQNFSSILKIDQRDNNRFTIVSISFIQPDRLMRQKEIAYEIPYGIKVGDGTMTHFKDEINAQILNEEVLNHEANFISQRNEDKYQKNIIVKWKNILELEKKQIDQEKSTLRYRNLKINERDASLEIEINIDMEYELNYNYEDMLQMTTKKNIHKSIDVGHMREFSDGHMIIDLIPYLY